MPICYSKMKFCTKNKNDDPFYSENIAKEDREEYNIGKYSILFIKIHLKKNMAKYF